MQFNCGQCGERIRLVGKVVGCPNGCADPFGYTEDKVGDLSEHFSKYELACHDCGECKLDPRLVPALEELRALGGGAAITVSCGCRCAKHNADVRGVSKSAHLDGEAADVQIAGKSLPEMYELALRVPAFQHGGIGIYDTGFIHVDVRTSGPARWARVNGLYMSMATSGLLEVHEA